MNHNFTPSITRGGTGISELKSFNFKINKNENFNSF